MNFLKKLFQDNTYSVRLYCSNCHNGDDFLAIEKGKSVDQEFRDRKRDGSQVLCSNCGSEEIHMADFQ